ncbi:substrate-binding domain-containing protein [Brachybacterium sp. YJGR34]|uniref:substrate-binding domain-containing protein n=1 Tax=Brachybacterium sp. YJGR34 TaxID=2059911 RepID=UPI000E0A85CD|nr:substrate-binding domain-containing protein [Brachybacterium sp. YJGR34]
MISRRHFLGAASASTAALGLGACASRGPASDDVVRYWGLGAADAHMDAEVISAFQATEAGSGIEIDVNQVPSNGAADMSQIITAVRGGTAPDLWYMDRFNAVQNASVGLLEPIEDIIEEFEGVSVEEFSAQWLRFAVDELTYDGELYGLPVNTDARGLMYNEDLLREAGVDLSLLDPQQHVLTWDELREIARTVTSVDERGNYETLGFVPWDGEGWPYTWGFGLDAQLYSNESASVTLDSPEWLAVFDLYADWAEEFPYPNVDAFFATYQPPNAPPTQTAMFSERLGITTTGPFSIRGNERYAPDLNLKFTWLPVSAEGDETYTWSGGASLVVPKGANITRNLWEFMKFYAGYEGQKILIPLLGDLPTHLQAISDGHYNPKAELFRQMLPTSTSRPPLPVGSLAWNTLTRARSSVTIGSQTPTETVESTQQSVAPKMALFEGYQMPETYGRRSEIPED